jgi:hypothetical protein
MSTNASLMSTNDGLILTKRTDRAANRYLLAIRSSAGKSLKTSHSKKLVENFSTISEQNVTRAPNRPPTKLRAPRLRAVVVPIGEGHQQ